MKRLLVIVGAILMAVSISTASVAAGLGIGLTGNVTTLDTTGTETQARTSGTVNGSISEDVAIPEFFIEYVLDNNFAFGFSYVPVQELGSSSRTDTDLATATNTAEAELDNMIRLYVDVPLFYGTYVTGGISNTTIVTKEVLGTGSSYEDENVMGYSLGLGLKGMLGGSNWYYKAEYLWAEYDSYDDTTASGNRVTADTESTSAKLSLAYQF